MPRKRVSTAPKKNGNLVLTSLRARVAQVPTAPGVYRWLDAKGDVLYVGKAKNLRNRMRSYVAENGMKDQGPWKMALATQIHDFDVTVTRNELEALLLETNLIKERKPKYNVLMKDDKHYVYLRVTVDEDYPRTEIVRKMTQDKAKYFGPFLTAYELRHTLEILHRVLGYRACRQSLDLLNRSAQNGLITKPCLESQIGQCNGLCAGTITYEEYRARIAALLSFFKGDYDPVIKRATELMKQAAMERKFERAAEFRNALTYIDSLKVKQSVSDTSKEDIDAIGIALLSQKAQVVLLRKRGGKLLSEYQISLAGMAENETAVLAQFIPQYFNATDDIPSVILVPSEVPDSVLLEEWLTNRRGAKVALHVPARGKKSSLLDLAMNNAEQKIRQNEAKWESEMRKIEDALKHLKDAMRLPDIPKRIEGYDISHLGGDYTSGSMVVFIDGKPKRDQYRSFTVKSLTDGAVDDYAALSEVLRRRLNYLSFGFEQEASEWGKRGVQAARSRKSDVPVIQKILNERANVSEPLEPSEFFVVREGDAVIGFARLRAINKATYIIDDLWIDAAKEALPLTHFLLRRMIRTVAKGKIFTRIDQREENFYGDLGFRHVHALSDNLQKELKIGRDDLSDRAVLFDALQNKTDVSFATPPDLLLIDGGKGQLNAAVKILKQSGLSIPVAGLAKRLEEVFLPNEKHSIDLPANSSASFLLQRLRNEAHRFSNKLREGKGMRALIQSALDSLPGIGPKTKTRLLKKFGSIAAIKGATDSELRTIVNETQLSAIRSLS